LTSTAWASWSAIGAERARAHKPGITISICGEHGGNPESIAFCRRAGVDYVSCSPFRVPVARLAAAHKLLREFSDFRRDFADLSPISVAIPQQR
jgi:phosphoenolpyruvate-protein kinase (PTS system EI component)